MKAMVLHQVAPIATAPLRLVERPEPEPGPGEVRLRVSCCAICRTDLHVIEGELPRPKLPLIPGHRVVGTVAVLGAGGSRLAIGQRADRLAEAHLRGVPALRGRAGEPLRVVAVHGLPRRRRRCRGRGGPRGVRLRGPEAFAAAEAAPLLCAGIIGYRALKRSELPPGGTLGLFGFGSSAHVVLQITRARGS